jgi:DNA-binding NarL/FixJ family response regulator
MSAPSPADLRIVLCDDSGIFRAGLGMLLERLGVQVVASLADVPSLLEAVRTLRPDVAVVDVRMPPTHTDEGIVAAITLHRDVPTTGVLVLSTYVDPRWAIDLLDAIPDGVGYLLKDRVADAADLLDAIRRVAMRGIALDPEVVATLVAQQRKVAPLRDLTPREMQVLALLAEGRSNAGIADGLTLSVKTVETHIASVFRALGLDPTQTENRRVRAALTYLGAQDVRAMLGARPTHEM